MHSSGEAGVRGRWSWGAPATTTSDTCSSAAARAGAVLARRLHTSRAASAPPCEKPKTPAMRSIPFAWTKRSSDATVFVQSAQGRRKVRGGRGGGKACSRKKETRVGEAFVSGAGCSPSGSCHHDLMAMSSPSSSGRSKGASGKWNLHHIKRGCSCRGGGRGRERGREGGEKERERERAREGERKKGGERERACVCVLLTHTLSHTHTHSFTLSYSLDQWEFFAKVSDYAVQPLLKQFASLPLAMKHKYMLLLLLLHLACLSVYSAVSSSSSSSRPLLRVSAFIIVENLQHC